MARGRLYYSPRLDRDLIAPLYRTAQDRRIPMTRLASELIREGLARVDDKSEGAERVCETPPDDDPAPAE